ncbi:unnamed protein product [Amoebophrya sp. A25]|nr:unnamed protein product [Amoebophrya sp. A25]|eukprot:GSA25T00019460001.1
MASRRSPLDFTQGVVGKPVVVKLNSGADFRGSLVCLDGYMNVVLAPGSTEYSSAGARVARHSNDCFLRGNNVLYISADKEVVV